MSTTASIDTDTTKTSTTTIVPTKVNSEQAVAFSALILVDENVAITPEKLQALLKAAGIIEVEPIWTTLFANALKGKDVLDILTAITTSSPAGSNSSAHGCDSDDLDNGGSEPDGVDIGAGSDSDDEMCAFAFFG